MKFIIEHLSKRFEHKEVLKDINFTFEEGKIYGLLGRNGAGKTTLFNCLNRDIKAGQRQFLSGGKRRTQGGCGGGHRVCSLHPHCTGVSHRKGVSQVLFGHQYRLHPESPASGRVF